MVRLPWVVLVWLSVAASPVWAQDSESVDGMVRQLQGPPRTRSLRNLVVAQLPLLDKLSKALKDERLAQTRFAVEGHFTCSIEVEEPQ